MPYNTLSKWQLCITDLTESRKVFVGRCGSKEATSDFKEVMVLGENS